jgi:hypothetical protein
MQDQGALRVPKGVFGVGLSGAPNYIHAIADNHAIRLALDDRCRLPQSRGSMRESPGDLFTVRFPRDFWR